MFIREYLEERKLKKERIEKLKTSVIGWLIISLLGGIGTLTYKGWRLVSEHLKWG